ncbi:MAG TPA: extracellular solute-binding protein [Lachnospiraceae bacterium]|nr:extracellular solute-binding protein [Lachnospiraceae bacterium]
MKNKWFKVIAASLAACMTISLAACGSSGQSASTAASTAQTASTESAASDAAASSGTVSGAGTESGSSDLLPDADGNTTAGDYTFPLSKTETIKGLTQYPASTEADPNKRTIFKRLEAKTNVHVEWDAIQSDQWKDKISTIMADYNNIPEFIFTAGFSNSDLLKYGDQGVILNLEDYIEKDMPNLSAILKKYPEYKAMCTDTNGHIWGLPWIEQLGSEKTAIQTVGDMGFINKKWLDALSLPVPTTTDELESDLIAFRDNAAKLQSQFGIDGSVIPMSFIINDGDQDPAFLINGFGEGYGDPDRGAHIAVTDDKKVICSAVQDGYKKGLTWLNKLNTENLIDPEAFTQDWSTYVSKGKSHRYGVLFSWDVANIDNLEDYVPLNALKADTTNITPQTGSFTSGFDRGRCVITAKAANPDLICAWLDQMYDPYQSPQDNWGTYGESDGFDIFELSTNSEGQPMLKHADLGDKSPVEVREAESVNGPLAVLDEYYNKYVTCPDDAQYRLDWIKQYYTPNMNLKYCYPNVFMSTEDTEKLSNLQADIKTCINTAKSDFVMNGLTDDSWNEYLKELDGYGINDYVALYQKYLDSYFASVSDTTSGS